MGIRKVVFYQESLRIIWDSHTARGITQENPISGKEARMVVLRKFHFFSVQNTRNMYL